MYFAPQALVTRQFADGRGDRDRATASDLDRGVRFGNLGSPPDDRRAPAFLSEALSGLSAPLCLP